MTRVAVIGAHGRLGRFACERLDAHPEFEVAARLGKDDDLAARLADTDAPLGLDLTVAGLGARHATLMLENGLRPVVGTSGVTPEEADALDRLARERDLGGLVVPNFSLGVCLQQKLAREVAEHFPNVEIIESHHAGKKDAPSGTALDTERRLREVTGKEAPVHSVRLPGLYSNQEVVFGNDGEVLRLIHETYSLEAFGPGIELALRHAATAEGVAVGLEHALPPR